MIHLKEIYIPEIIEKYVSGKEFYTDSTGLSGSSVLIFDSCVLKISEAQKHDKNSGLMENWLRNKDFVPKILCSCAENGLEYVLMSRIPGKMACGDEYMKKPEALFSAVCDAMKMLWETDISGCPVKNDLSTLFREAEYRLEHGMFDIDDAEPETFGKNGFKDPEELLSWLYTNRPEEDFVLSHGDFCLPNVFVEHGKFSGFVDTERMGISDRYLDIALCYRSLRHNFAGRYGGTAYGEFDEKLFFGILGIEPDYDKIRYYILLDEFF